MAMAETDQTPSPAPPPASPASQRARALGLPSATALVIGSIIGTGVFTMPAVMAGAGTSSLLVLGVIAIGAVTARDHVRSAHPAGPELPMAGSTPTPATSSATSPGI